MDKTLARYVIVDEPGDFSLEDLIQANEDGLNEKDVAEIRQLSVGQSVTFGGGAAAECEIKRIA